MKSDEQIKWEDELCNNRIQEQKDNEDYLLDENKEREKCECGMFINSHDHCPRCDY